MPNNDSLRKIDPVINNFKDSKFIALARGFTAGLTHHLMAVFLGIIAIFSFDFKTLSIALVFLLLITLVNVLTHNCPLTQIELEVFGDCLTDMVNKYLPINYDCNRRYEVQLQYIITATAIVMVKLSFLLIKKDLNKILSISS